MAEPRWRRLLQACLAAETAPTARFLQLASVGTDGRPTVRTVVFRGFASSLLTSSSDVGTLSSDPDSDDALAMCTDARSAKVPALRAHPFAELCWYFVAPRVQFRLTGRARVVAGDDAAAAGGEALAGARAALWARLSRPARAQFFAPAPGTPTGAAGGGDGGSGGASAAVAAASGDGGRGSVGGAQPPDAGADDEVPPMPDCFALLLVVPTRVDVVDLRAGTRTLFERDGADGWVEHDVVP